MFLSLKVIALIGKGGAGKSTIFANLGIQLYHNSPNIAGIDWDARKILSYDHKNMGISITNMESDINYFNKYRQQIMETIFKIKENNHLLLNFPGDKTAELFFELIDIIDEIIIVTHQENNATHTTPNLVTNIFKYLQERNNYKKFFNRIFLIYNLLGEKYTEQQFDNRSFRDKIFGKQKNVQKQEDIQSKIDSPGKKYVDKLLFNPFSKEIERLFWQNNIEKTFKVQGIYWPEEKNNPTDITFTPLYHLPRSPLVALSGMKKEPFILNYLNNNNYEELPLPVIAIKENAGFLNNMILNKK